MTEHFLRLQKWIPWTRLPVQASQYALPEQMRRDCENDRTIINKPFHLKGDGDVCVMLVHGWTSTPYEMRVLGSELNEQGIAVDAPLLSGHGTRPQDLENITWDRWVADVDRAYKRLRKQYARVYVGGMSMGGNLALHVAKNNPDVCGVILMSTPYRMRFQTVGMTLAYVTKRFISYKKKYYPRWLQSQASITQLISYQKYPISSAFEAHVAIRRSFDDVNRVQQPVFLIQSTSDHLVARNSIAKIYKKIGSQRKEMRLIKHASHNFMGNGAHKDVFQDVVRFVLDGER